MVRAGFKPENFKTGKYGYQDRIRVVPAELKNKTLSGCSQEIANTVFATLRKAKKPYVALVFELNSRAFF
jgi:hypothetical protein